MNAEDVLKYGHLTVVGTIQSLPEGEWETPDVCGWWSSKEIIAHLASFEHLLEEILGHIVSGHPTPTVDRFFASHQGFNEVEVARRQGMTPEEVWVEYEGTHVQTLALIAQIPVERRRQPGILPAYGSEYDLEDFIAYTFYGHKREHSAQIAVFVDQLTRRKQGAA